MKIIESIIAIVLVAVFSVFGIKSVNENKNRMEAISESLIGKTFVYYEQEVRLVEDALVEDAIKERNLRGKDYFGTYTDEIELTFISEDTVEYTYKHDYIYSDLAKSISTSFEDSHKKGEETYSYTITATSIIIDGENWKFEYDEDTMTVISIIDDSGYNRGDVYKVQK